MAIETTTAGGVSLTVIFVALLGPKFGPYALIALASIAGALWPLSAKSTDTRKEGALLLLRCALTAIIATLFIAGLMERFWEIPVNESMATVALVIGALGNGWRPVFDAIGAAMASLASKPGGARNEP